ncbi:MULTISPECIES: Tat pathway signal protein [unclassified Paenarthrobacter]|uniref:Tat pathway signal protein n=1 Tax=unclassified Paenarthrobacter TaxID=2634190 RepID=UPI003CE6B1C7
MDPKDGAGNPAGGPDNNGRDNSGWDAGSTGSNTPKPPPWQVPKPELRPDMAGSGPVPQAPEGKGKGKRGATANAAPHQPEPGKPLPVVDPFAKEREREAAHAEARKKRSRRRTVVVGLGVTALLAGTITAVVASNEAEADYAQVCFNEETGERVDDSQCNNSSSAGRSSGVYAWYFYSRGASVPAVGQNRSSYPSYTKTVPQGAKTSTGYSSKGGTVSRGGFGSSSKSGGSSGG